MTWKHFIRIGGMLVLLILVAGLFAWAFVAGREELQKESESEKPIPVASHARRTADGSTLIYLDKEARKLLGIKMQDVRRQKAGVLVPRSSIVREGGKTWIYVERTPGEYLRFEIVLKKLVEKGWIISKKLPPKTRIVSIGAQMLLSEELKSRIQMGD